MDIIAAMLLISPFVWEHHFVIALPLLIWLFRWRAASSPVLVFLIVVMITWIPVFDLYPFTFQRIAGLLLLVYSLKPGHSFSSLKEKGRWAAPE